MSSHSPYLIERDARRNYMRLTFLAPMDATTLPVFERDLGEAYTRMRAEGGRPGSYVTLVDVRASGVQPKDITVGLQAIIARYGPLSRRIAMLMSASPLEMMQAKRVAGREGTVFFRDESEATAWLFSEEDGVAGPA